MKIGKAGTQLIKQFEGCKLDAYKCPADVWTIGYGHTGPLVVPGLRVTQWKADELLLGDLEQFERIVNKHVTVPLSQSEFDALVSFAFNVGPGAKDIKDGFVTLKSGKPSTMLTRLNARDYAGAANEFPKWNKIGGLVSVGLSRRRKAEQDLFLTDVA